MRKIFMVMSLIASLLFPLVTLAQHGRGHGGSRERHSVPRDTPGHGHGMRGHHRGRFESHEFHGRELRWQNEHRFCRGGHFFFGAVHFVIIDEWPIDWREDDSYTIVLIDDDYFLMSPVHPGVRVVIRIS